MRKSNAVWLTVNAVVVAIICVLAYVYQKMGFSQKIKFINSATFSALGFFNLAYALITKRAKPIFYIGMAIGLFFAFLADYFIDRNFVLGVAVFALAHISFVLAYCFLQKYKLLDLFVSLALFLSSAIFLLVVPFVNYDIFALRLVCVGYALIISSMVGKSLGNFIRNKNYSTGVMAFASVLFFFSDLMLVFSAFVTNWKWADNVCMGTYYPAVSLLAFATCLQGILDGKKKGRKREDVIL